MTQSPPSAKGHEKGELEQEEKARVPSTSFE